MGLEWRKGEQIMPELVVPAVTAPGGTTSS